MKIPKRHKIFLSTTQRINTLYRDFHSYPIFAQLSLYFTQGISHYAFWYKYTACFSLCIICITYIALSSLFDNDVNKFSQTQHWTIMLFAFIIALTMIPKLSQMKDIQRREILYRRDHNQSTLYSLLKDIQPDQQTGYKERRHSKDRRLQFPYKKTKRAIDKEEHIQSRYIKTQLQQIEAKEQKKRQERRQKNFGQFLQLNGLTQQKFQIYKCKTFTWIKQRLIESVLSNFIIYLDRINQLLMQFELAIVPQFWRQNMSSSSIYYTHHITPNEIDDIYQLLSVQFDQGKPIIKQNSDLTQLQIYKSNYHQGKTLSMPDFSDKVLSVIQKISSKSLSIFNLLRFKQSYETTDLIKQNLFIMIPILAEIMQNFFIPGYMDGSKQQWHIANRMREILKFRQCQDLQGQEYDFRGNKGYYPTDVEIIQHLLNLYLDSRWSYKDMINQKRAKGKIAIQNQFPAIVDYKFFQRSNYLAKNVEIIILRTKDFKNSKDPYYQVYFNGKFLPTLGGKSSIVCAMVHFFNLASSMGGVYRGKDLLGDLDYIFSER